MVALKCVAGPDEPPHAANASAAATNPILGIRPPQGYGPPRRFDSGQAARFPKKMGRFQPRRTFVALAGTALPGKALRLHRSAGAEAPPRCACAIQATTR